MAVYMRNNVPSGFYLFHSRDFPEIPYISTQPSWRTILSLIAIGDVARLGCRNWKTVALNREGWRKLLKEAEAHPGLYRHWRETDCDRTKMKGTFFKDKVPFRLYLFCHLVAGLLARSQYPEGPAIGHLGTRFSWFTCV
jgi:hypothetical protein